MCVVPDLGFYTYVRKGAKCLFSQVLCSDIEFTQGEIKIHPLCLEKEFYVIFMITEDIIYFACPLLCQRRNFLVGTPPIVML